MCFAPSTSSAPSGAGCKPRLESRIQRFNAVLYLYESLELRKSRRSIQISRSVKRFGVLSSLDENSFATGSGPSFEPACQESTACIEALKTGRWTPGVCKCSGHANGGPLLPNLEMVDLLQIPKSLVRHLWVLGLRPLSPHVCCMESFSSKVCSSMRISKIL